MKKIILFAVIILSMSLFFVSCPGPTPEPFDITGTWNTTLNYPGFGVSYLGTITFEGEVDSGTTTWNIDIWPTSYGTYTVTDMDVTFDVTWQSNQNVTTCVGTASDDNNMSGTLSESGGATGDWIATR